MSFSDCPHPRSDLIVTERSKPTHKHDIHSNNNNNKNNNNEVDKKGHVMKTGFIGMLMRQKTMNAEIRE